MVIFQPSFIQVWRSILELCTHPQQVFSMLFLHIEFNRHFVIYCRPQTKFAKVMFLHVSVCPRGTEVPGQVLPGQVHPSPLGQVPPWAGTPWAGTPLVGTPPWPGTPPQASTPRQVHHPWAGTSHPWAGTPPPFRYTPSGYTPPGRYTPPGTVHAGRYGQQAGSTHPTGIHSCLYCKTTNIIPGRFTAPRQGLHFFSCDSVQSNDNGILFVVLQRSGTTTEQCEVNSGDDDRGL